MTTAMLDGWFKFNVGDGAFFSVFGFLFVFAGITVLILFFTLLGLIMKKITAKRAARKEKARERPVKTEAEPPLQAEEDSPEIVAAIAAALSAYYEKENVRCDFVVKRIRRI